MLSHLANTWFSLWNRSYRIKYNINNIKTLWNGITRGPKTCPGTKLFAKTLCKTIATAKVKWKWKWKRHNYSTWFDCNIRSQEYWLLTWRSTKRRKIRKKKSSTTEWNENIKSTLSVARVQTHTHSIDNIVVCIWECIFICFVYKNKIISIRLL